MATKNNFKFLPLNMALVLNFYMLRYLDSNPATLTIFYGNEIGKRPRHPKTYPPLCMLL
jgi:hypothetical protein